VGVGLAASSGSTVAGSTVAGAPGAGGELAAVRIGPAVPDEEPDENTAAVTSAATAAQHTTAQRPSSLSCRLRSGADCGPPRGTGKKRRNGARLAPPPPVSWDDPPVWRGLPVPLAMANLDSLAAEYDVAGFLPVPDPSPAMTVMFSDLVPEAILTRISKARCNRVVVNDRGRSHVEGWREGVDGDLVDAAALKRVWDPPEPHCLNLALLQACWLANRQVEPARG
jgi:hypothetical protein